MDLQGDLTTESARVEEFLDSAKAKGVTVREEPKGRPIFQLSSLKEKQTLSSPSWTAAAVML